MRLARHGAVVLLAVVLLVVIFHEEHNVLRFLRNDASTTAAQSLTVSPSVVQREQDPGNPVFRHRILCYGDSLTAGLDLGLSGSVFPYAPVLQRLLQDANHQRDYQVYLKSHSGWAAQDLRTGIAPRRGPHDSNPPRLQQVRPHDAILSVLKQVGNEKGQKNQDKATIIECAPVSLVIILIGTNDVNRCNSTAEEAFDHIRFLHNDALYGGSAAGDNSSNAARTVAIEIPFSQYQWNEPLRAKKAAAINEKLAAFASPAGEPRAAFMPFPFEFVPVSQVAKMKEQLGIHVKDSNISSVSQLPIPARFWCRDGNHLSPLGYEQLAKSLVPIVEEALTQVERECQKAGS
jgi:lysophospholipase L1-like esterase